MPVVSRLGPADLAELVGAAARVAEDHAPALDLLGSGPLDEVAPVAAGTDAGATEDRAAPRAVGTQQAISLADLARRLEDARDLAVTCTELEATAPAGGHEALDAVLRAFGEAFRNADVVDAERVAIGLELAAEALAPTDDGSHPGGFGAVVAATAGGALGSLDRGGSLLEVLVAAADDGLEELERGPVLDPELADRGAVDAAAAGYLLLVDTMAAWVAGDALPSPPAEPAGWTSPTSTGERRFVVGCSVEPFAADLEASDWLESVWHELGDVVHFGRSAGRWEVEVVTALPGPAIEALCEVGRPRELRVELCVDDLPGDPGTP